MKSKLTILLLFLLFTATQSVSAQIISAGQDHSLAVCGNGTMQSWGWNNYGQLGDGTTTDRHTPVQVNVVSGIIAVSAGGHTLSLKNNGTVWANGYNGSGQLGNGTTTQSINPGQVNLVTTAIAIAAGFT